MSRFICIVLVCLAWSWAIGVHSVAAQPYAQPAKTDRLVRVTYPVADLVVPIQDHSFRDFGKPRREPAGAREAIAERLMKTITGSVAKGSWESAGGAGSIQFFPFGMAIVVENRREVQEQIAKLLADLRRLQDVQVSVELRLVLVSAKGARELEQYVDKHGEVMRVFDRANSLNPNGGKSIRSLNDKQLLRFLEMVQGDRAAHIMQAPKLTLFNAQQATIAGVTQSAKGGREGLLCDVWPVVEPEHKSVRLALNLELSGRQPFNLSGMHVKAAGTFALPTGRTLVWHLGELKDRRQLFALATARVVTAEEEKPVVQRQIPATPDGGTEEQSLPEPKNLDKPEPQNQQPSAKERAIQDCLRQPISLNFKHVPLRQAVGDISLLTFVPIVFDETALKDAGVNADAEVSIVVDDVDMKSALRLVLNKLRLAFVIEKDAIKVTTPEKALGKLFRKTYNVADLVVPILCFEGQKQDKTKEVELMEVITNTVAKDSWESAGSVGTIQYFPKEKTLIINQYADSHEEIHVLLATLRRLQDLTVDADVRFLVASPKTAGHMRLVMATNASKFRAEEGDAKQSDGCVARAWPPGLAERLLKFFQADDAASIVQAPKLSLFNGQNISFQCVQKEAVLIEFKTPVREGFSIGKREDEGTVTTQREKILNGWRCGLQPVVSPDRRSVRLTMSVEHFRSDDAKPSERGTTAAKVFRVADGGTLMLYLGESARGKHKFVLLTPRIRVREETEPAVVPQSRTRSVTRAASAASRAVSAGQTTPPE